MVSQSFVSYSLLGLAFGFYCRLSFRIALASLIMVGPMLYALSFISEPLYPSLAIFFISWVLQFIGHHIEGKKPSFTQDVQFLLIGPIWVLGFLMKKMGLSY